MGDHPLIYEAICNAMTEIGAISKSKRNQQQGFLFRGIDDVMNVLYPILAKHRLFLSPEVLEHIREERQTKSGGNLIYSILKVRYTLYASDGSNVSAVVIGEGMDSADKSSNKAMAVAMKYAMFQIFCIPTEDMRDADPDAETPPESSPRPSRVARTPKLDRQKAVNEVMERIGLSSTAEFMSIVHDLQITGKLIRKSPKEMLDDEYQDMLRAVERSRNEAVS